MRRLIALLTAAVLVGGGSAAFAQAAATSGDQTAAPKETKADKGMKSDKAMTAAGTVKSLSGDSLVVTDKSGKDWTFAVDSSTKIVASGASHMTAEKKAEGKPVTLMDAVKEGAKVSVKYHEMDGKMHAASVRVL
jgi:hypothetical protein